MATDSDVQLLGIPSFSDSRQATFVPQVWPSRAFALLCCIHRTTPPPTPETRPHCRHPASASLLPCDCSDKTSSSRSLRREPFKRAKIVSSLYFPIERYFVSSPYPPIHHFPSSIQSSVHCRFQPTDNAPHPSKILSLLSETARRIR